VKLAVKGEEEESPGGCLEEGCLSTEEKITMKTPGTGFGRMVLRRRGKSLFAREKFYSKVADKEATVQPLKVREIETAPGESPGVV